MASYSDKSIERLQTAEADLQILFSHVIKYHDNTIVYGQRTPALQFELFKKGREYEDGKWFISNKKLVVTNCDGYDIKSDHNIEPLSHAVDAAPYPTLYSDENAVRHFAAMVLGIAKMLYDYGAIEHEIGSGIDWDNDNDLRDQKMFDACHFFIIQ